MADLDPLLELAGLAGAGLTTLPKDRDLLKKRIDKSIKSFAAETDRPGGEQYLFVMEDIARPPRRRRVRHCLQGRRLSAVLFVQDRKAAIRIQGDQDPQGSADPHAGGRA